MNESRIARPGDAVVSPASPEAAAPVIGVHDPAERLREATKPCRHNEAVLALTARIGVASTATPGEQLDPMLHTADQKLYEAKFGGRNRVVC